MFTRVNRRYADTQVKRSHVSERTRYRRTITEKIALCCDPERSVYDLSRVGHFECIYTTSCAHISASAACQRISASNQRYSPFTRDLSRLYALFATHHPSKRAHCGIKAVRMRRSGTSSFSLIGIAPIPTLLNSCIVSTSSCYFTHPSNLSFQSSTSCFGLRAAEISPFPTLPLTSSTYPLVRASALRHPGLLHLDRYRFDKIF